MKKLNFNLKDRKTLLLVLSLVMVSVFTLTVVYAALNIVLTIQGTAKVSAANWDIYLNNPRVTNGSATTDAPTIKTRSTLEFETTLNMPGDFYEFTVDVVNDGSLDAIIKNVVKNPELTVEQAKYLKYEITYQNGESITTKQILAKGTSMPIKVRIEYRKDLVASDLPTGQEVLDLLLTLEYIQSDGSGNSVNNNGAWFIGADGSLDKIGTLVTIGTEQFYTIGTQANNVKLLSRYNLMVGYEVNMDLDGNRLITPLTNPTGMQDSKAKGYDWDEENEAKRYPFIGTTSCMPDGKQTTYNYDKSNLKEYVNNYKTLLENTFGVVVAEARLITQAELTNSTTFACKAYYNCPDTYPWLYSTSYYTGTASRKCAGPMTVSVDGEFDCINYKSCYAVDDYGVRPVIVISKSYF